MNPDPERSQSVLERLDARHYGEPEDEDVATLAGVAPPCEMCGEREATERVDDILGAPFLDVCEDCLEEVSEC